MSKNDPSSGSVTVDHFPTFRPLLGRFGKRLRRIGSWFWSQKRRFAQGVLVLAAVWVLANIYATVVLNNALAAIRQRGEPLTLAEIVPPPVTDADNAAVFYERADMALHITREEEVELGGFNTRTDTPYPAEAMPAVRRRILSNNRAAIALIRQGTQRSKCQFRIDWSQSPYNITFAHYAILRRFSRVLLASATQEAFDGNMDQAVKDTASIFHISHHAFSEHLLISLLVSNTIEKIGYHAMSNILTLAPKIADRNQLAAILPKNDLQAELKQALLGERAFGLVGIQQLWARGIWQPITKLDMVYYLKIHPANGSGQPMPTSFPWYAFGSKMLFPAFDKVHLATDRLQTMRNLSVVAIDLEIYKGQHGRYPASLKQLESATGKTLPTDVFGNKEFVYKPAQNNFKLYSAGLNRKDDNGLYHQSPIPTADDVAWPQL